MSEHQPSGESTDDRSEEDKPPLERRQDNRRLSALTIYSIIRAEGLEELRRPSASLWWSGVAAGIGISTSLLAEGVLRAEFLGHPDLHIIQSLGYTMGFMLVILSRLQLFTENTITVILPLLAEPKRETLGHTAKLWAIVFVANIVGTAAVALVSSYLQPVSDEYLSAMIDIARDSLEVTGWAAVSHGIPAGFFIAAIVWMLPSSRGFEIFVIFFFTYLIAAGGFSHVIVGSAKMSLLVVTGEIGIWVAMVGNILPALIGNVIGGTGLFALLAYGQVHEEF